LADELSRVSPREQKFSNAFLELVLCMCVFVWTIYSLRGRAIYHNEKGRSSGAGNVSERNEKREKAGRKGGKEEKVDEGQNRTMDARPSSTKTHSGF
jgi:general stress protein YciG